MSSTIKLNGYDPIDYVESGYPSNNNEPTQLDNSSNTVGMRLQFHADGIFSRLSRVIYSIFDWSSNTKQYNPHPTDNNV